jgi:hypothetical protein
VTPSNINPKSQNELRGQASRRVKFRGDKKRAIDTRPRKPRRQPGQAFARPHWYIRGLTFMTSISKSFGVLSKVFLKVSPMAASIMVKVPMHKFDVHGPQRGNPNMTRRIVALDIPSSARVVIRNLFHYYRRRRSHHDDRALSFMTLNYTSCKTQCCQNTQQANHHLHFFFSFLFFMQLTIQISIVVLFPAFSIYQLPEYSPIIPPLQLSNLLYCHKGLA